VNSLFLTSCHLHELDDDTGDSDSGNDLHYSTGVDPEKSWNVKDVKKVATMAESTRMRLKSASQNSGCVYLMTVDGVTVTSPQTLLLEEERRLYSLNPVPLHEKVSAPWTYSRREDHLKRMEARQSTTLTKYYQLIDWM
jgi:hypothetical protein